MQRSLDKFNRLVEAFETLPTVGRKSALRFAYHLVLNDNFNAMKLAHSIETAISTIRKCSKCGSISENEICDICLDENRENKILCIVESPKDIFIMEENGIFGGKYFVLESLDEKILKMLENFIEENNTEEIVFALTPSLSTDGIVIFIEERLKNKNINFTKIAQGVPTGVSLENIDALSLTKAMQLRVKT